MSYLCTFVGISDSGKTTIVDRLCTKTHKKNKDELLRNITITLGYGQFKIGPNEFYVLDTPGHQKFKVTALRVLSAVDLIFYVLDSEVIKSTKKLEYTLNHLRTLNLLHGAKLKLVYNKIDLVTKDEFKILAKTVEDAVPLKEKPLLMSALNEKTWVLFYRFLENLDLHNSPTEPVAVAFKTLKSFDVNRPGTALAQVKGGVLGGVSYVPLADLASGDLYINDEFLRKKTKLKVINVKEAVKLSNGRSIVTIESEYDPVTCVNDKRKNTVLWTGPAEYCKTLRIATTQNFDKARKGEKVKIIVESVCAEGVVRRQSGPQLEISFLEHTGVIAFPGARALVLKADSKVEVENYKISSTGTVI